MSRYLFIAALALAGGYTWGFADGTAVSQWQPRAYLGGDH